MGADRTTSTAFITLPSSSLLDSTVSILPTISPVVSSSERLLMSRMRLSCLRLPRLTARYKSIPPGTKKRPQASDSSTVTSRFRSGIKPSAAVRIKRYSQHSQSNLSFIGTPPVC